MKKLYIVALLLSLICVPIEQTHANKSKDIVQTLVGLGMTAFGGAGTIYCLKKNKSIKAACAKLKKKRKKLIKLLEIEEFDKLTQDEIYAKEELQESIKELLVVTLGLKMDQDTKLSEIDKILRKKQSRYKLGAAVSVAIAILGLLAAGDGAKGLSNKSKDAKKARARYAEERERARASKSGREESRQAAIRLRKVLEASKRARKARDAAEKASTAQVHSDIMNDDTSPHPLDFITNETGNQASFTNSPSSLDYTSETCRREYKIKMEKRRARYAKRRAERKEEAIKQEAEYKKLIRESELIEKSTYAEQPKDQFDKGPEAPEEVDYVCSEDSQTHADSISVPEFPEVVFNPMSIPVVRMEDQHPDEARSTDEEQDLY